MTDQTINPFELLGVTPTSELSQAQQAFRELAVVTHPDKGGSAGQMRVLLNAYRFVKEGLTSVKESQSAMDYSMDELEEQFKEFCQVEGPVMTEEIERECIKEITGFDVTAFNQRFDKEHGIIAAVKEGYGDLMDAPEDKPMKPLHRELIVYKEPEFTDPAEDLVPMNDYVNVFNEVKEDIDNQIEINKHKIDASVNEQFEIEKQLRNTDIP